MAERVRDPVCGMMIDPQKTDLTAQYQGHTYYFCGAGCLKEFEEDPEGFVAHPAAEQQPHREHEGGA